MNILAIDTSSKRCSVGIKYKDKKYINISDEDKTHSEKLMPLLDKTLKEAGLTLNQIDTLSVVIGPGSFTGIRIGIATVKGIALANNIKVAQIKSTKLLAGNIIHDVDYKIPMIYARNNQIYAEIYTKDNTSVYEFAGDFEVFLEDLKEKIISKEISSIAFVGTGADEFKESILLKFKGILQNDKIIFEKNNMQEPLKLLDITEEEVLKGNVRDGKEVLPHYLKSSNAERMKSGK